MLRELWAKPSAGQAPTQWSAKDTFKGVTSGTQGFSNLHARVSTQSPLAALWDGKSIKVYYQAVDTTTLTVAYTENWAASTLNSNLIWATKFAKSSGF